MRIPGDWEIKRLIEIADIKGGKRLPKGYSLQDEYNGHPYITVSDMYEGGISDKNVKYVPIEVVDQIKRYRIKKGDLFISVAGTLGIVGKVPDKFHNANLTENADMITNIKIDKEYLFQVLISPIVQKEIEKVKTTSAQPKLALERIRNFTIPVPKHEKEMQKIADILSTWDKAIELKEKLIEQKKEQKKGLMQRLLTGKVRLPGFEGEWKEVRLGDIIEFYNGYPFKSSTYKDGGKYKIITIANVQDGKLDLSKCNLIDEIPDDLQDYQILKQGDILLSMTGNVGRVCIVDEDNCLLNQRVGKIHPKKVDKWFLYFILRSERFLKEMMNKAQGGAQGNLSVKDIKEYKLVIPDISEQEKLGKLLRMNEREVTLLEQEKKLLIEQKKGLMQLLLTGKVRVKC